MTLLLADVGGTNTRVALAHGDRPDLATLARFRNDDFDGFAAVLAAYLERVGAGAIEKACVAVAGPVMGRSARLTNRDWHFDPDAIGGQLGGAPVVLINDLAALARALDAVTPELLSGVHAPTPQTEGQAVVVGMGTGFNVAIRHGTPAGPAVLPVEFGHAALPCTVAAALDCAGSRGAQAFPTIESAFAGPGLARYCERAIGCQLPPADLLEQARAEPAGPIAAAVRTHARALGVLVGEMLDIYLPDRGITLAGTVARGLLSGSGRDAFLAGYLDSRRIGLSPDEVPLSLITDDAAALHGCLARLRAG